MEKTKVRSSKARDAIIDAATELFSETGYSGTTMRDIAQKIGVLPGSLYAHIKSKEELLLEIVSTGINEFLEIESTINSLEDTAENKLRAAIAIHVQIATDNTSRVLVVFHQWRFLTEPNLSQTAKMRHDYAQLYTDILNEGVRSGEFSAELDSKVEVFSILGALNWIPEWYSPKGDYTPNQIGIKMADTLILGLSNRD